jgi:hypothetical protein
MNWNAFKRLFHYLGRYKLRLILVMIAAVLSTLFTVLTPAVTGGITSELYDGVASGSFDWESYTVPCFNVFLSHRRIVREIFSRYDKGELIKNIMKDLNARGLRNNFNRPFQASAMTLLLKNRKYIGDYRYGDTIIPGGVPALVEKDVFERVQRRMEANKKSPGRAKAKEEYLLSGKVFCGTCGGHMVGECGKSRNGTFYYYYKCINAKHGHTCKRKALKRDWLERAVVVETVTKVLTDEVIDRVADAIIAIQGQENPMIPSIKEQLRVCDKGLKNLLKAIEAGIFTPTTKERMEELERQKEELNISLIRAQMAQPVFTKEEIVKWISRFKYGNINDKAYQREMIDTFLNSVYVYNDKIVFTYNFRDHAETVTLDEIEYVFCSDVNDCPPPKTTNRKAESLAVLLYLQVRIHPLPHQYTAFNDDGKLEFPYTLSVPPRGCQLHGRGQSKHDVHIHFRKHSATDSAGSQYNSLLHRLWSESPHPGTPLRQDKP